MQTNLHTYNDFIDFIKKYDLIARNFSDNEESKKGIFLFNGSNQIYFFFKLNLATRILNIEKVISRIKASCGDSIEFWDENTIINYDYNNVDGEHIILHKTIPIAQPDQTYRLFIKLNDYKKSSLI